jgi:hypothetical protein
VIFRWSFLVHSGNIAVRLQLFNQCQKSESKFKNIKKEVDFSTLCKNHKISYLYAFDSSTTDKINDIKSDLDLLVRIDDPDPIERGENLVCFILLLIKPIALNALRLYNYSILLSQIH